MIEFDITDKLFFIKTDIVESLRLVIDPELHINIIDMGLVYNVNVDETEGKICIEMTLSSSYCPMGESIVSAVKNCIELHFPGFITEVLLVWDPVWTYDNLSEEGKRLLS
ncbi:MAG: metal-sulfur cluster assembly factor [Flavobacterium sp.]|nr:metal-sulfur cluster assembly factor [Pedobacter sp.]